MECSNYYIIQSIGKVCVNLRYNKKNIRLNLKVQIIKIEFDSYNFWWDKLSSEYGNILDSHQLLDFINKKKQVVSERTFNDLAKDGVSLPVGIKPKGKWLFGLDAVLRWYLGVSK